MDTWKILLKGNEDSYEEPKLFEINSTVYAPFKDNVTKFIEVFLSKHGLVHLYALNTACMTVLETAAHEFQFNREKIIDIVYKTIKDNIELFNKIEKVIDYAELNDDLEKLTSEKESLNALSPNGILAIAQLSYQIQKTIESDRWSMDDKAMAYICSLTKGNVCKFDHESFVYQLSRGIDCNESINNFIPFIQEGTDHNELKRFEYHYKAGFIRFLHKAGIGNINNKAKTYLKSIRIKSPYILFDEFYSQEAIDSDKIFIDYDSCFYQDIPDFMITPFPLFRIDAVTESLKKKLYDYILKCQKWLPHYIHLDQSIYDQNPELETACISIAACYLFGTYRLGRSNFDTKTISDSTAFLLNHQLKDGSFFPFDSFGLELNAQVIHALWTSNIFGCKRAINRATHWLRKRQHPYGFWLCPLSKSESYIDESFISSFYADWEFSISGYLTGLILDALELDKTNPNLTFSKPSLSQKQNQVKQAHNQPNAGKHIKQIKIDTINYIYGNNNPVPKNKSQPAKKKKTAPGEDKFQIWDKKRYDAKLKVDKNDRIKFHYQEEEWDLRIKHSGPVYEFIKELYWGEKTKDQLKTNKALMINSKGNERVISDIIRRTNETFNSKIKLLSEKHKLSGIPDNIKFVGYDSNENIYRFYFPIEHST